MIDRIEERMKINRKKMKKEKKKKEEVGALMLN